MSAKFATDAIGAIPIHVLEPGDLPEWVATQDEASANWVAACGFTGKLGEVVTVPFPSGRPAACLAGWGDGKLRARGRFHMATIAGKLPEGVYQIASGLEGADLEQAALGWLLSAYAFDRYKDKKGSVAQLVAPEGVDAARLEVLAEADALTRDLINTPASDMGPEALEHAVHDLANRFSAKMKVIRGEALLRQNFPMIHAVGRAADQVPRLLDLTWGRSSDPMVTLVGKGVCFDTGGLNIKPASSMGLMKKDMGGAATMIGLAQMIMALGLPVRLRLLVPAVENSISAGAYRPQDVLTSRKGLTVEVNNTDAEGRLVLADALALADEEEPDLLICGATLTGAARVALGPDVPPFFTDDDALAAAIAQAAAVTADPLWRMPFWPPYEADIEPDVADLDNAPKGGFAGSITAALFLRRFVDRAASFVHLDLYGWTPKALPGRSLGGACQSARALLQVIEARYPK
jgi:leucyl aminopeptidase